MSLDIPLVIGANIGPTAIDICQLNSKGRLLEYHEINLLYPLLPGFITVSLWQALETIDIEHDAKLIGVCLPSKIESCQNSHLITMDIPGWIDVPLSKWLEIYLRRKVIIGDSSTCIFREKPSYISNTCDYNINLLAIGAAHLALGYFTGFAAHSPREDN